MRTCFPFRLALVQRWSCFLSWLAAAESPCSTGLPAVDERRLRVRSNFADAENAGWSERTDLHICVPVAVLQAAFSLVWGHFGPAARSVIYSLCGSGRHLARVWIMLQGETTFAGAPAAWCW